MLATAVHEVGGHFQSSSPLLEPKYVIRPDSLSVPRSSFGNAVVSPWTNSMPTANKSQVTKGMFLFLEILDLMIFLIYLQLFSDSNTKIQSYISLSDDLGLVGATVVHNYSSSSNESTTKIWPLSETNNYVKEKTRKARGENIFHSVLYQ